MRQGKLCHHHEAESLSEMKTELCLMSEMRQTSGDLVKNSLISAKIR